MGFLDIFRSYRVIAFDPAVWHKCNPIFPRRTIDGSWTGITQTWRRQRKDGKWEYRQDEPTADDWWDRQY